MLTGPASAALVRARNVVAWLAVYIACYGAAVGLRRTHGALTGPAHAERD